ncbi:MAG TPA: alanine racemase [Ilumatobacteraceae bacterium]|nr:alanine racemase [Ilumatobacteraceae bacterium]
MEVHELATPALVIDADRLSANLATMAQVRPGAGLRPHVKAHKCTALAATQFAEGHRGFTCATVREVRGMAAAGLGDDLLLANEVIDRRRLADMTTTCEHHGARVTVAVDSPETVDAAAASGVREVLVDVSVGMPRCGCAPGEAGRIADLARHRGLEVRGVMGYEGHLMVIDDHERQRDQVAASMDLLLRAHADVGGDVVSAGGTGTCHLHDRVTEVQAGSYVLMDTHYARMALPYVQACWVMGTVIAATSRHAVADVGLKAMGMDHGNPSVETLDGNGADVWFFSDEHVTFVPHAGVASVGDRVHVIPAHIDPTMTLHEAAWLVRGHEVIDRWPIDLRGW